MYTLDFDSVIVSQYIYSNRDIIPIIDTIRITNELYGRFDIIINKYYRGRMDYLNLLYDYNNISNPLNVKIGDFIDIPDFNTIINNLMINEIFENDIVPGINISTDSQIVNDNNNKESTENKNISIPKLQIEQKSVTYNSSTGELIY